MRRGISPVIAVTLLLMMTVAISGGAFFWVYSVQSRTQGAVGTQTSTITTQSATALNVVGMTIDAVEDKLEITLHNSGESSVPPGTVAFTIEDDEQRVIKTATVTLNDNFIQHEFLNLSIDLDGSLIQNETYNVKVTFPGGVTVTSDATVGGSGFRVVSCTDDPECEDYCVGDVRHYSGSCVSNLCTWVTQTCSCGCTSGSCVVDNCGSITCDDYCVGDNRYYDGSCSCNKCYYSIENCPLGCSAGSCVPCSTTCDGSCEHSTCFGIDPDCDVSGNPTLECCGNSNCGSGEACYSDCSSETWCSDGVDNDEDGSIDDIDFDCSCGNAVCGFGEPCSADCSSETHCTDNVDNDEDGLTDNNDLDCFLMDYSDTTCFSIGYEWLVNSHYPGTYSFEGETGVTGSSISFIDIDDSTGGLVPEVISGIDGHNEVLVLDDTSTSDSLTITNLFSSSQTSGIVEFWLRSNNPSNNVNVFALRSGTSTGSIIRFNSGNLEYWDGDYAILTPFSSNTWYHIRVDFDCTTDTYSVYVNGTLLASDGVFITPLTTADRFLVQTWFNQDGMTTYYDAISYSWDTSYDVNDSLLPGCCGNDGSDDDFYNGTLSSTDSFCLNGQYINQEIDANQSICENWGFDWISGTLITAAQDNPRCCADDGSSDFFGNASHCCNTGVFETSACAE